METKKINQEEANRLFELLERLQDDKKIIYADKTDKAIETIKSFLLDY